MNTYGLTVRKIRQDKGFLQKEIYDDVVAKSFAIRFEKGEVMLQYDTFLNVLANLNVTPTEFHYIHENYHLRKDKTIWQEFLAAVNSQHPRRLLDFYNSYHQSTVVFQLVLSYFSHFKYIVDNVGLVQSSGEIPKKELSFVENYFLKKEAWTLDDMMLLTNFYQVFPVRVQKKLVASCYKSMRLYKDYPGHINRVTDLLSSYILFCYNTGEIKEGNSWYIKLQSLQQDKEEIYASLRINLCGAYYYYLKGELAQGQNILDDVCLVLNLVGYEREAKIHRKNFKNFQHTHSK